jgi:hypothetical protein
MKWPSREARREEIADALDLFSKNIVQLQGLTTPERRDALSTQIIASLRREDYFALIQKRVPIAAYRADPTDRRFEPELGVVYFLQHRQIDEAAWLIFLMVYFARPEEGWKRLADVYGRLGGARWDWAAVSADPTAFSRWIAGAWNRIGGKFGNHRKYASLKPTAPCPIGPAFEGYVQWVLRDGGHPGLFARLIREAGNDPHRIFDVFFQALPVKGFGRLGRFDWVAMLPVMGSLQPNLGQRT